MSEEELLNKIFGGEYKPTERDLKVDGKDIRIKSCSICGWYLECPRCGNNLCNAGSGKEENGEPCTLCLKAYELQDALHKCSDLIEELLINGRKPTDRDEHRKKHW